MGVIALVCLGRAILLLGAGRAAAYIALDLVLTIVIAVPAGEVSTAGDVAAAVVIAGGAFLATRQTGDGPVNRVMTRLVARPLRPGSPDSRAVA